MATTNVLGPEIEIVDAGSFIPMYHEIFEAQIYRFKAQDSTPYIVDAGANIGLSAIYFKRLYPQAEIIAFEPDRQVFKVLQSNLRRLHLANIQLIEKALWSSETTLEFAAEGADGGRLGSNPAAAQTYTVQTTRLRDYLRRRVDLLKIDIEGAETEVIKDCQALLSNVANLFVEYHSMAGQPQSLPQLLNILSESGFRLHISTPFAIDTPFIISRQPLYEQHSHMGMDFQLNIFAFRPS